MHDVIQTIEILLKIYHKLMIYIQQYQLNEFVQNQIHCYCF